MKLSWHGHACFTLETAEGTAVFDPYAPGSVPGLKLPPLTADEVICSHGHGDHNAAREVKLSGKAVGYKKTQLKCYHDDRQGALRGENLITVIEAEGLRVAHLGDLGHELSEQQLAELGKIDLLLIPVGGHYTIDGNTAAKLAKALNPKLIIPMHYRGEGFGYEVIGPVDEFLAAFSEVRYLDGSELSFDANTERGVYVLTCPTI